MCEVYMCILTCATHTYIHISKNRLRGALEEQSALRGIYEPSTTGRNGLSLPYWVKPGAVARWGIGGYLSDLSPL